MSEPVIVISRWRVKEGRGDELAAWYAQIADIVERTEPRVVAYNAFLSDDGSEMTNVQVHPDAASMEFHMQVLRNLSEELWSAYADMLEVNTIEYYGAPSESALAMDRKMGTPTSVQTRRIGGFTRPTG